MPPLLWKFLEGYTTFEEVKGGSYRGGPTLQDAIRMGFMGACKPEKSTAKDEVFFNKNKVARRCRKIAEVLYVPMTHTFVVLKCYWPRAHEPTNKTDH